MLTKIEIRSLHRKLKKIKSAARNYKCNDCEKQALDWSNISREYLSIEDFVPRCRSCHTRYDGKVVNLKGKHCPKGFKHSYETKVKVSASLIGNKRALGNKHRLGVILSNEIKEKISKAHQGKVLSDEHKNKIRDSMIIARRKKNWSTRRKVNVK